jgi:hypothetical protein
VYLQPRQLNNLDFRRLPFVTVQRRQSHLGLPRIGGCKNNCVSGQREMKGSRTWPLPMKC